MVINFSLVARHACLLSRKSLYVSDANELPSLFLPRAIGRCSAAPRTESRETRWFTVSTSVRRRQLLYSSDSIEKLDESARIVLARERDKEVTEERKHRDERSKEHERKTQVEEEREERYK